MPLWLQILLALNSLTIPLLAMGFVVSLYWQPITARAGKVAGVFSPLAKYRQLLIGILIGAVGVWAGQALGGGLPSWSWPGWLHLPSIVSVDHGPKKIEILRETADASPDFNGQMVLLRKDPIDAYLKSKGHTFDILDLDAKNKDGQPLPWVTEVKTAYPALKPPLLIMRNAANKIVYAESIPVDVKAATILETVKAKE